MERCNPTCSSKRNSKAFYDDVECYPSKKWYNHAFKSLQFSSRQNFKFKHHFKLPISDYAKVHQQEEPHNSMAVRTLGAICLGLIDNAQGGYKFMSLATGKMIK